MCASCSFYSTLTVSLRRTFSIWNLQTLPKNLWFSNLYLRYKLGIIKTTFYNAFVDFVSPPQDFYSFNLKDILERLQSW